MKERIKPERAFTLVELLVAMAIIGILAGLLLTALSPSKANAKRTACLNNLKQINYGIRMYCDDSGGISPAAKMPSFAYKDLIKSYVGLKGGSSPQDRIFACPADTFHYETTKDGRDFYLTNAAMHESKRYNYTSYWFNGMNFPPRTNAHPALGIAGVKIASIEEPPKTVLVAEAPASYPYSWHQPDAPMQLSPGDIPMFNNAQDVVSFVDGHASYIKMFWDESVRAYSFFYNPPAGYDYKWSGD